jgi:hypothetical protein
VAVSGTSSYSWERVVSPPTSFENWIFRPAHPKGKRVFLLAEGNTKDGTGSEKKRRMRRFFQPKPFSYLTRLSNSIKA